MRPREVEKIIQADGWIYKNTRGSHKLPGCVQGGETLADAILMAEDAASGWVLDELEEGRPAPKASSIGAVTPDEGGFVSLLTLDMDAYAEKFGNKAVRKNLTITA